MSPAAGRAGIANPGAHGFSEILYAFSSAANNNGSAFAGLSANTPFYNTLLGIVMWISRFWLIVPVLAIAGSLAAKKHVPAGAGTLPTHTPLFVVLLAATVLIVGALAFFPALALGPIVEELQFHARVALKPDAPSRTAMTTVARARPLFDPPLVKAAIRDSFVKLAPWVQWRNPVMFVVLVGSVLITALWLVQLGGGLASEGRPRLRARDRAVAVGHAAVRQFRREPGRRAAARRRPPRCDRASAT